MRRHLSIWWIDDEGDRLTPTAQRAIQKPTHPLMKGRKAILDVKQVKAESDIRAIVVALSEAAATQTTPDLVVIDQMLNVVSPDGLVQLGSSVAVMLRAQVPTVPLVGVTGASFQKVASLQRDQFIEFVSRDAVHKGDCIPDLFAIADGFAALPKPAEKGVALSSRQKQLLRLIAVPDEDADLLLSCIPGEFKSRWDKETPHAFARWVWHVLMGHPGFLYDDMEIATLVGLKESGLRRISNRLRGSEYKGVFASITRRRWWVSTVRAKIRNMTDASSSEPLSTLGRKLVGLEHRAEFSKCYGAKALKECVPDVVAYKDERCDLTNRVQARVEDTVLVENDTPPLGFEQRRRFV